MKKILQVSMMCAFAGLVLWQCSGNDDPAPSPTPGPDTVPPVDTTPTVVVPPQGDAPHADSVAKYAALRAWKATAGLPQTFVWYDDWTGTVATSKTSMRSLPDSVTIISNWGQPKWPLSNIRRTDMRYMQEVKGAKVVVTLFSATVGDDVPADPDYATIGTSNVENVVRPVIRKYAEAIYDAVIASGYDGFDWDFEPTVGGQTVAQAPLWKVSTQRSVFVDELSYWFGPGATEPGRDRDGRKAAKPGLLFLIDGEVGSSYAMQMELNWPFRYVDYFVHQAYGSATVAALNTRVNGTINRIQDAINPDDKLSPAEVVRRCILTENFESYATDGGGILVQSSYVHTANGVDQQIGGFGIYRVGMDYNGVTKKYKFLPQGITNLYRIYRSRQ